MQATLRRQPRLAVSNLHERQVLASLRLATLITTQRILLQAFAAFPQQAWNLSAACCRSIVQVATALALRLHAVPQLRPDWSSSLCCASKGLPVALARQPQPEAQRLAAALLTGLQQEATAFAGAVATADMAIGAATEAAAKKAPVGCRVTQFALYVVISRLLTVRSEMLVEQRESLWQYTVLLAAPCRWGRKQITFS